MNREQVKKEAREFTVTRHNSELWRDFVEFALTMMEKQREEDAEALIEMANNYGAIHPGMSTTTTNRRDDYVAERVLRNAAAAIRG